MDGTGLVVEVHNELELLEALGAAAQDIIILMHDGIYELGAHQISTTLSIEQGMSYLQNENAYLWLRAAISSGFKQKKAAKIKSFI